MSTTTTTMPTGISKTPRTVKTQGGTAGISTTNLVLTQPTAGITPGMIITSNTGTIPHNTTVVAIDDDNINVTASQNLSLTDGRHVTFNTNDNTVKQFEFTVTPGEGKTLNLTEFVVIPTNSVATSNSVIATTTGSHGAGSTQLNLAAGDGDPGVTGIITGMKFTFAGAERTVTSITSGSTLTFTPATEASIAAPVEVTFEKAQNGADTVLRQIEAVKNGDDIIIKGTVEVASIPNDDTINIEIDNFINVTT